MATKAFLAAPKLAKELESQGFQIEATTAGFRVLAPDGGRTAAYHLSQMDRPNNRTYQNLVAELRRIGFDWPDGGKPRPRKEKAPMTTETEAPPDTSILTDRVVDVGRGSMALYEAVVAEPGLPPKEYAARLGISPTSVSSRAATLREHGLLRIEGRTKASRYQPVAEGVQVRVMDEVKRSRPRSGRVKTRSLPPEERPVEVQVRDSLKRLGQAAEELVGAAKAIEEKVGPLLAEHAEMTRKIKLFERKLEGLVEVF